MRDRPRESPLLRYDRRHPGETPEMSGPAMSLTVLYPLVCPWIADVEYRVQQVVVKHLRTAGGHVTRGHSVTTHRTHIPGDKATCTAREPDGRTIEPDEALTLQQIVVTEKGKSYRDGTRGKQSSQQVHRLRVNSPGRIPDVCCCWKGCRWLTDRSTARLESFPSKASTR